MTAQNSLTEQKELSTATDGEKLFAQIKLQHSHFSVCACGKWTCTSEICIEGYRDIENRVHEDDDDWGDEDGEDPEDDPDVQDIRWF